MRKLYKLVFILAISVIFCGCDSAESLFNGKDLEGWECDPPEQAGDWKAADGVLLGENPGEQASIICTLTDDYDTGIFIRGLTHQVQIGISRSLQKDMTACIYAPKDEQGSYPGQTDKVVSIHKIMEWNHLKVIVTGKRIQTILNDEPMVDYTGIVLVDEGPIGLQLHGGVHMSLKFKNIKVREL